MDLKEKFYWQMLRIRKFEDKVAELRKAGVINLPMIHLYAGEEAIAVGFCEALKPEDKVIGWLRGHGWYLARGGDMKALFAELLGKEGACARGFGGSMHAVDLKVNHLGICAITGGGMPIATGIAFALRLKNEKAVAVVAFGEGGTEEGTFYEALNIAALKKVPAIFVCEKNQYSVHKRIEEDRANTDIAEIAKALGVQSERVYGQFVEDVYEVAKRAREIALQGSPVLVEALTYRYYEHMGVGRGEKEGKRKEELPMWLDRDPLKLIRIPEEKKEQIEKMVEKEIEEALSDVLNRRFLEVTWK